MSLLSLLTPTYSIASVMLLSPEICRSLHINALLLDIDNTLTTHNNPEPYIGLNRWVKTMQQEGIRLIVVSNNRPPRVSAFAGRIGLPYMARAAKPLPSAFRKTVKKFGCSPEHTAVVGDQLLTDILGANLARLPGILVTSITPEHGQFFRFKRRIERKVLEKVGANIRPLS